MVHSRVLFEEKNVLENKILVKNNKTKIYQTLLIPLLMYAAKNHVDDDEKLRAGRKILRKILESKGRNKRYRRRTNDDDDDNNDIIYRIKRQRVQWYEYVIRSGEKNIVNVENNKKAKESMTNLAGGS